MIRLFPRLSGFPVVEWRAQQIADPVERLRFLRRHALAAPPTRHLPHAVWRIAPALMIAAIGAYFLLPTGTVASAPIRVVPVRMSSPPAPTAIPQVWRVDAQSAAETYSNGLRIETQYTTAHQPRQYQPYDAATLAPLPNTDQPAGIVFHTTESHQERFAAEHNDRLTRLGANLLSFIKANASYHYVIDRFGRVYRVVQESDTANHAGHSLWADRDRAYFQLNRSFIGIAFEAGTDEHGSVTVNPAQLHAGRILTEMLRSRYRIIGANCLTHAQVSVNPDNMQIGYHTDWAGGFPFHELGLPDNYQLPPPSLARFGFDDYALAASPIIAPVFRRSLHEANAALRLAAEHEGMSLSRYRQRLRGRYRLIAAAQRASGPVEERKLHGSDD